MYRLTVFGLNNTVLRVSTFKVKPSNKRLSNIHDRESMKYGAYVRLQLKAIEGLDKKDIELKDRLTLLN